MGSGKDLASNSEQDLKTKEKDNLTRENSKKMGKGPAGEGS